MSAVPHVIVCGAGLTGLTTAWHLQRAGADVTVLEAGDDVGGVMRSVRRDGYLVEQGPNSSMLTPEMARLVDALGLTPQLRPAAPQAQRRYIVRDGRALAVPSSPGSLIGSPLLSFAAKLRILREPFIARRSSASDESVASFVRRRLGDEPLAWGVDPFVSGVYAGDPEQLSVSHAFPRLAALEREHGSLLRGAIAKARGARVARTQASMSGGRATMVSFVDGMGALPHALGAAIGGANILHRARVTRIDASNGAARVTIESDGATRVLDADAIVSTLPMHAFTSMNLPDSVQAPLAQLAALPYPPVASLALGFRREDVAHALDGFGCLIPSSERRHTLGILFSTTLFDGRAPDGHVLLTCFLGGVRHPELGLAPTADLVERVLPELRDLLGVTGAPTFVQHTAWPRAIPQYNVGHGAMSVAADAIEAAIPSLLVDGQFRRGVSVGDCIAAGERIATRALGVARMAAERRGEAEGRSGNGLSPNHGTPAAVA